MLRRSRVKFACLALASGLILGVVVGILLAFMFLRLDDGGAESLVAIAYAAVVGGSVGAALGLLAGLVLPILYGRKHTHPTRQEVRIPSDEGA